MYRLQLLILGLFSSIVASSQYYDDKSQVSPPNASNEFMLKVNYSADQSTGALNFSIPLLSLKIDREMEIPITISYYGNGISYDQISGEVGLGWSISSNFKINRSIYGRPDEHYSKASDQALNDIYFMQDNVSRDRELTKFTKGLHSNGGLWFSEGAYQELDGEYDIFNYNLPSLNGSFILDDKNGNTILSTSGPLGIYNYNVDPFTGIDEFNFTDPVGNKFLVGYDDIENKYLSESIPRYGKQASYSWPLTKLVTSNNRVAYFQYSTFKLFNPSYFQLGKIIMETDLEISTAVDDATDASTVFSNSYLPSSIKSDFGEIVFSRNSQSGRIQNIILKDHTGKQIKKVIFYYDYKYRFDFLEKVEVTVDDEIVESYIFEYYKKNESLTFYPNIWGNLQSGSHGNKYFPQELSSETFWDWDYYYTNLISKTFSSIGGSFQDRSANQIPNSLSLKKVTYPTGGEVQFTYESNFYQKSPGLIAQGPGIRIKQISQIDNISNQTYIDTYNYGIDGNGIGELPYEINKYNFGLDKINISVDNLQIGPNGELFLIATRQRLFSNDIVSENDPYFRNYNIIRYPEIKISNEKGSTKIHFHYQKKMSAFRNTGQNMQFILKKLMNIPTEFRPVFVYEYFLNSKALPELIEIRDKSDNLVKEELYEYDYYGNRTFMQMKIKPYAEFNNGYFDMDLDYVYDGFDALYDFSPSLIDIKFPLLKEKIVKEFSGSSFMENRERYYYNEFQQLIKIINNSAEGKNNQIEYSYPTQFSGSFSPTGLTNDISIMISNNILNNWIEKREYTYGINESESAKKLINAHFRSYFPETSLIKQEYNFFNSEGVEFNQVYKSGTSLIIDSRYQKVLKELLEVDEYNNPLRIISEEGIEQFQIWGYGNRYLIAIIRNIDNADFQSLYDYHLTTENDNDLLKIGLENLRINISNIGKVQMTSYLHKPLVGIEREDFLNGNWFQFIYDHLNRLSFIVDNKGNLVSKFCYSFKGVPESCEVSVIPSWINTNTPVRCKKNNNENTGQLEQEQIDTNPWSPTFNQTRWVNAGYDLEACPLPCNSNTCYLESQKCVKGICEEGVKVYTGADFDMETGGWLCYYHYEFSDGSWSQTYSEISHFACWFN